MFAAIDCRPRWRQRLGEITAPTLVIHGDEDPFFPHRNGVVLAAEIPGAMLLTLPGIGQDVPRVTWPSRRGRPAAPHLLTAAPYRRHRIERGRPGRVERGMMSRWTYRWSRRSRTTGPSIRRLLQLYHYDFSEFDGSDVNPHGEYLHRYFDEYWTDSDRKAFLFRVEGALAASPWSLPENLTTSPNFS